MIILAGTDAVIAEFGGECYVAMSAVAVKSERQIAEIGNPVERYETRESLVSLTCDCGAGLEWSRPPTKEPFWFRYTGHNRLSIVRTQAAEPPCEHWLKTPLSL